jgi:hypothetical protein
MIGVTTADQIVREDLSNLFINIDKRTTTYTSRLKRGEDVQNVKLFSWAIESYDGRMTEGIPENKDVDAFESDKQQQLYGRTQKFWRRPHVTVEANTINRAPADFGKYNKQVVKKTEEQKRDIEQRLLSDNDSRDDDGLIGREFMGLGRFVNDATSVGVAGAALTFTDTQTAIPVAFRTPTAQIYVGNLTTSAVLTFDGDTINTMLQNRFDSFGPAPEFSGFVDALLKRHFTKIERYIKTMTNYTAVQQRYNEPFSSPRYVDYGSDLWDSDFGAIDINLVAWAPRTSTNALSGRGYFLDMSNMYLRPSGLYLTHQQQEDKGAGPRGLIQSILGPQYGDPRAHLKVDPNVAAG